jgi:ribosome maturation factor RimP
MIQKKDIEKIAEEYLIAFPHLFVVDIIVKAGNKIMVRIDSDNALLIHDCKMLSRHIENTLDREKEDFELEVSSPGIDFPLVNTRQYKKNIGRTIAITLKENSVKKGVLKQVDENSISIEIKEKKKKETTVETIATQAIEKVNIVLEF